MTRIAIDRWRWSEVAGYCHPRIDTAWTLADVWCLVLEMRAAVARGVNSPLIVMAGIDGGGELCVVVTGPTRRARAMLDAAALGADVTSALALIPGVAR
jgi:hypothetical protein